MRERVADVIVPITGGRLDMLAKATATLPMFSKSSIFVRNSGA